MLLQQSQIMLGVIAMIGLGLVCHAGAQTAPLAYENFNYSPGTIAGQNGGTGWSGGWVDVSGNAAESVAAGNLAAGARMPSGFDARSAGNALFVGNGSRAGRWLDVSSTGPFGQAGYLNGSGNIGANGKTLYVSFLQQASSAGYFYEFEFHRDNLGDSGRIAGIGNDLANAATVNLRAPGSTHTPFALGDTNVNFYVVRIDFKAGNDDVYVYRNPQGITEAANEPALTMLGVADMSFDGLSMGAYLNGVTVRHDEIRVGQTWASVLGNPPVFVTQATNQTVPAGQAASLVSLAQSSQPLNYQWYRRDADGTNLLSGKTNPTLTLASVQTSDAGRYFVVASNILGSAASSMATLEVKTLLASIEGPPTLTLGNGESLTLHASVDGASPVTLQWYKNGEAIPGATDASLVMSGTNSFDAGQYLFVAGNAYGAVTNVVNVLPDSGGLLAYEGFGYGQSGSDLAGANGGFGWGGVWQNVGGGAFSQSLPDSLAAGGNAPGDYDSHSVPGALHQSNGGRKGRLLDCSPTGNVALRGYLDAHGNLGADGKTLYLSFLQQPDGTALFYELELHRGDLGDGGRVGGIGNDTADSHVHLRMESPPGGSSSFGDLGAGNTGVNFYVLRIDFKPGNDDLFVYRNPTSAAEPATPTLVLSNAADFSFNGISLAAFANGRTVSHDEIRLGVGWSDVVGQGISASDLELVEHTTNETCLRLAGTPNFTYQLQAATSLSGPWSNLASVWLTGFGVGGWTDTNATNLERFYRAVNPPFWSSPLASDIVLAGFEGASYGTWSASGTAFGSGPAHGTLSSQQTVSGFYGSGLVNSFNGGDAATGTLTSPPFVLTKPFLNFLIGGGNHPGLECLNLIVSNVVVKTATGSDTETLAPRQWDVSAWLGQTATLQITDAATGGWGHVLVDQIVLSDTPAPTPTRQLVLTNKLLNLPVNNAAPRRRVTLLVDGTPVRDFNIRLAEGAPDWWAFVDVSPFLGQTATLMVDGGSIASGLDAIVQTNGLVDATNLYQEALRPQIHFSPQRGWLNDPNGMVYYRGQFHLYYQADPFNWDGGGQKYWGHAVSPDMVNWRELPVGIYSHTYGDDVWSGSAVVDAANTSGFKTGTNDVIVAAFTSTGRGECIAFSNDGGLSFTDYTNNPVVTHSGTGRDPHLLWYAPSNYWVMAVYDDAGGNGVQFYSSPNLRNWTFRSKIANGFFECPDMFPLPVDGDTNNVQWLLCDASAGYMLGQFNGATFTPATNKLPGHQGANYYATQTFHNQPPGDPRKVRVGWAQIGMPGMPFNQQMYFPTELTLKTATNGVRLCSLPVSEITNAIVNVYSWTNLTLNAGSNPLSGIRGTLFDLKARFTSGSAQTIAFNFQGVTVSCDAAAQTISCNGITNPLPPQNGMVQVEIIVDRDTIEIFGNDGSLFMPLPVSNPAGNSLISLTTTGGAATFQSLTINKLKPIWPVN